MNSKEATIFISTICIVSLGVHFYLYRERQALVEVAPAPVEACPTPVCPPPPQEGQKNVLSQMKSLQVLGFTPQATTNPFAQGGASAADSGSFEMMKHSSNIEVVRAVPPRAASFSVSFPLDAPLEGIIRDTISALVSEHCGACKVEDALKDITSVLKENRIIKKPGERPTIPQFPPSYCGSCMISGASDEMGQRSRVSLSVTSGRLPQPSISPAPPSKSGMTPAKRP
jgi:hypothetical protein